MQGSKYLSNSRSCAEESFLCQVGKAQLCENDTESLGANHPTLVKEVGIHLSPLGYHLEDIANGPRRRIADMAKILEKEKGRRGDTCHILQGEYNAFDSESIPLYCYRFSYLDIHLYSDQL
jgi:hypothetical protein